MLPLVLLTTYSLLIVAASLIGGLMPTLWRLSHTSLQVLMSGVGGFMLGVAVLHLLPHGIGHTGLAVDWCVGWMLTGIVAMFCLIRVFHVHQHATTEPEGHHTHTTPASLEVIQPHPCDHDHHAHFHHDPAVDVQNRGFSWLGLALGLSVHTLIDGLALGASVASGFVGSLPIFLAVLLHKPLDALSITSTMSTGGWSRNHQRVANFVFSLMCPLGAMLFYFGAAGGPRENLIVGTALAFSAGVFLCVALADILPELSFHSHDRFSLTAALLIGIASAYIIGLFEPQLWHGSQSAFPGK